MYFASRAQAGRQLAAQLVPKYRYENCVVVALNNGGITVGAEIARQLHCVLLLLRRDDSIFSPRPEAFISASSQDTAAYNHSYSHGQIDELEQESSGYRQQAQLSRTHELNKLIGHSGTVDRSRLKGHSVIVVSDGMKSGFPVEVAVEFFKLVAIEAFVVAVPLASVDAVDRMHVTADALYCLDVVEEYIETAHYYETPDVPDEAGALAIIEHIILNWQWNK
jgi:putative phosphoribosyl transferase